MSPGRTLAMALSFGALLAGAMADRLWRHGTGPQHLLSGLAILSVAARLALILRLPLPSLSPWLVIAVAGAGTVLSYAMAAECFLKEAAGRANGALNACHLGWAFVFQCATGLVLDQWPSQDGHYPAIAYQVAFVISRYYKQIPDLPNSGSNPGARPLRTQPKRWHRHL